MRPRWRRKSGCAAAPTRCCRPVSSPFPACCRAEQAIRHIKAAIRKTYGGKGEEVVRSNFQAVDDTLGAAVRGAILPRKPPVASSGPARARRTRRSSCAQVTARMMEGRGDEIPVSCMPVDGTFPSGTAAWEKRNIADEVPVWEPDLCVQCGQCSFVCPHRVIRAKILRRAQAGRRAGQLQIGADQCARLSRTCASRLQF